MELSSLTLKKLSYISGGKLQSLKIKQKKRLKVVSHDIFWAFAIVKHREANVK